MTLSLRGRARAVIVLWIIGVLAAPGCAATPRAAAVTTDPLPSWHDSAAKRAIVAFVTNVTLRGSPSFVPVPERIAVFDNDGTLWVEQLARRPALARPSTKRLHATGSSST